MQGTKLGPYEILEQLGAGGMGEVWLAQDTRLGRKVAVKVLPEQFASDPDRLARFEQEARAAAALNHPNIAAVYDVGAEASEGGGSTHFMVQEYLEGQSLRDLLDKGPLSTKKALALGTEIAEALKTAHRAGIVHRDLKPENLFVSPDGHAKVLDFGLAKLTEMATGPLNSQSMSPTVLGTQAGAIMGTAGYMAPEQVQGEEVDARADVFALGCVLWEMLTGTRAFAGKSVPHTLHKILDEAPEGHDSEAGKALPLRLRWLLDRTLAKSPEDRAQSTGDVAAELRQIASEVESGKAITEQAATEPRPAGASEPSAAGLSMKTAVPAAVLLLLVGAAIAWLLLRPAPPEPELLWRLEVPYPDGTAIEQGNNRSIAISPDGSMIAFEADAQLWIRRVDELEPTVIRNTEELRTPFFSPDGQQIGFWAGGQIKRVAVTGGAPVVIGPTEGAPVGASWGGDGFIYVGQGAGGIVRLPATGGPAEQVVEVEEGFDAHGPELLPGGEWLLFTLAESASGWDAASIVAQSLTTDERRILVAGGRDARVTSTGHLLFGLAGVLFAQPFDTSTISVSGGPVSLLEGIRVSNGNRTGSLQYHVNERGDLIHVRGGASLGVAKTIVWRDGSGSATPLPFEPRDFRNLALSSDGTRIAADIAEEGVGNVWLYSTDRPGGQRLTQEGGFAPVWSPDGAWVYFGSPGFSTSRIWRRRADLSAPPEQFFEDDGRQVPMEFSSDGNILLYAQVTDTGPDVAILRLGEEPEPEILVPGDSDAWPQTISPDGRFVAFTSGESGRNEVYVIEVENRRRWLISTSGGILARWSPDGRTLYYVQGDGLWSVEVSTDPDFTSSPPRQLFQARMQPFGQDYAIAPDSERLLWINAPLDGGLDAAPERGERIFVTLNWFQELEARVPRSR